MFPLTHWHLIGIALVVISLAILIRYGDKMSNVDRSIMAIPLFASIFFFWPAALGIGVLFLINELFEKRKAK